MKKIIFSIICLFSLQFSAQFNSLVDNGLGLPSDNAVFNKVKDPATSKNMSYDEIQGSPYFDKSFTPAMMAENYDSAPARYNSYDDRIEYRKDDKIFFLPLENQFERVVFTSTNKIFVLLETNDDYKGYFLELINGENRLYKKIKTKFIESAPASNTYSTDKPAYFKTLAPFYYIETKNGFIKQPKNQKEFLNSYIGDDKDKILIFFKENKIKFDSEKDLIKLVNFLNKK